MSQALGIVSLKVDGLELDPQEGASVLLGGKTRETKMGGRAVHFKEQSAPSKFKVKIVPTADVDLLDLQDKKNATVEFTGDNGIAYVAHNCFTTNQLELAGGGEVDIEMEGDPAIRA